MTATIRQVWRPGSLRDADAIAEAVAAKDLNNLYRTSCYFRDPERYRAFCAMYAVMRIIDDRIDDLVARGHVAATERRRESRVLRAWHCVVSACLAGRPPARNDAVQTEHPHIDELQTVFSTAARRFPVPAVLWDDFFSAMQQDLDRDRFLTYADFVSYATGAAVAPTSIYLYLITAERRGETGVYHPAPDFDLIQCGRDLGLFAYIAHVLRDLSQDLTTGDRGLLYLAADDMATHGVTERMLFADLASGSGSAPLRRLVRDLVDRARTLARRGRGRLRVLQRTLSRDRAFILELIVRIYEAALDRIESCSCDPMTGAHRLTEVEKKEIAGSLAAGMGLVLVPAAPRAGVG